MPPETVLVFLNNKAIHAPAGSTLGQLVAREAPDLAPGLEGGQVTATDGRGVPVTAAERLASGAIFRVQRSARVTGGPAADA